MENSCGRAVRGDDEGREKFASLCRMLLIVFQRARGLDEDNSIQFRLPLKNET